MVDWYLEEVTSQLHAINGAFLWLALIGLGLGEHVSPAQTLGILLIILVVSLVKSF